MAEDAPKVALLDEIKPEAHNVLHQAGFEVITFPRSASVDELTAVAKGVEMMGVRSTPEIPAAVIENSPNLHAIAGFCVSPKVDHDAANSEGVAVFNSVHENTRSVAEHVIGSIFNLLRRTSEHSQNMHAGTWTKTDERSFEVRRKKLGIVGYGNIGIQVGDLAERAGMDVAYYDPKTIFPSLGRTERKETLEDLLSDIDIVTLHVPDTPATINMINARTIALMKPGSYIINAARGGLVDYEAVKDALDSGQLAGIQVDVFEDEPKKKGDSFAHVLQGEEKAILTPHVAGSTIESQTDIGNVVARKMVRFWETGDPYESRTLPKLQFEDLEPGNKRIVYYHSNEPGALAQAQQVIADAGYNVVGERLKVDPDLDRGLAYFDIEDGEFEKGVIDKIKELTVTRRVRLAG